MHDDVLARLDGHLAELALIRGDLVRARPVHPGERRVALLRAVRTSRRFVRETAKLLYADAGRPRGVHRHRVGGLPAGDR